MKAAGLIHHIQQMAGLFYETLYVALWVILSEGDIKYLHVISAWSQTIIDSVTCSTATTNQTHSIRDSSSVDFELDSDSNARKPHSYSCDSGFLSLMSPAVHKHLMCSEESTVLLKGKKNIPWHSVHTSSSTRNHLRKRETWGLSALTVSKPLKT